MKRFLRRKLALLCLALLALTLLSNATRAPNPTLVEQSAVIRGDHAAIRVMPSRFTASLGVCFRGQRLAVWAPGLFGFYRARCNGRVGWIAGERVAITAPRKSDLGSHKT